MSMVSQDEVFGEQFIVIKRSHKYCINTGVHKDGRDGHFPLIVYSNRDKYSHESVKKLISNICILIKRRRCLKYYLPLICDYV